MSKRVRGFSIVQALVGISIATIGVMIVTNLISHSQKGSKTVSSSADFNNTVNSILLMLSYDPAACGNAFRASNGLAPITLPASLTAGPLSPAIAVPRLTLGGGDLYNANMAPGTWTYSLSIDRIFDTTKAPTYLANLHFEMAPSANTNKSEFAAGKKTKDFVIRVTVDASHNIVSCANQAPSGDPILTPAGTSLPDVIVCPGTRSGVPWQGSFIFNSYLAGIGYYYSMPADTGADPASYFIVISPTPPYKVKGVGYGISGPTSPSTVTLSPSKCGAIGNLVNDLSHYNLAGTPGSAVP